MNFTGPRLSQIAKCPRAGSLQAAGHEPAEPTDRQRLLFRRGHLFGEYAYQTLLEQYDGTLEREREIHWTMTAPSGQTFEGIGHADFYLPAEKQIREIKSSTDVYRIVNTAITQAKLYLHFDPEAETAVVQIINPVSLLQDEIPVKLTERDREDLPSLLQTVAAGADGGPLPACAEGSPGACKQSGCLYYEHAWDGWDNQPTELQLTPEVEHLLRRWNGFKDLERQGNLARDDRKLIEAELVQAGVKPGQNHVGDWVVKRIVAKGRTTFSYATAEKAGVLDGLEEILAPFVKVSEPSERFEVVNTG
jgi:hypothetical protein